MSVKASTPRLTARQPIAWRYPLLQSQAKGALRRPFLFPHELLEEPEELFPFGGGEVGRHAALVELDAALQLRDQTAARRSEPQPVGAAVLAAPALDQPAPLQDVKHAHHGGAL